MKRRSYGHSRPNGFKEDWTGLLFLIAAAALALSAQMAQAQTHTVLKHFGILSKVTGLNPRAPLVQGPDGTLYGTTSSLGGGDGYGTVFKIQPDGTGFTVVKCFTNSVDGATPYAGLVLSGGTLYGTTRGTAQESGSSGPGMTVFKVNTDGTGFAVLRRFAGGSDGGQLSAGLVLSGSTLYGTTPFGGSSGKGTVFKINTNGTGYTVLKSFAGSDGANPFAVLALSGGTLYGTTWNGGSSGKGTVFKVNTNGTGYTVLKSFTGSDGWMPWGGLVVSGGTLYGTTYAGGDSSQGTVFKMNTDGTGHTVLKSFTGSDGGYPQADLVLSGGTLYGTTRQDGSSGDGTVFKVNTDGTGFLILKHFTGGEGSTFMAGLVLSGSALYGTTESGGSSDDAGTVFKVNTDGTGFAVLKSFTRSDVALPSGLVLSAGTLYGTTGQGGSFSHGTVFKVNTNGTGYTVLMNFTPSSGAQMPQGDLVLSGDTLYGTSWDNCASPVDYGTVFKVNTEGTGFTVLKSFTGGDGWGPQSGLALSDGTLYGTTQKGGSFSKGTVFKVNTSGTGYTVLKNFTGGDGDLPMAGLVLSGGTVYGTTLLGGSSNKGTVFKVNTNGTGYTVLKHFTGADGATPRAGLVLSGNTLYGTTYYGGSSGKGTVFKMNMDGTGYTVLRSFTGSDGMYPRGLVLSGGTLYGTTWSSEVRDDGTVFKVNTDGTGFAVLKRFTGSDGSGPQTLVSLGDTLYGTTVLGGNLNNGTVFRIDVTGGMAPVIDSQPQSWLNRVGSTTGFSVTAIGTDPIACQWRKNAVDLADGVQPSGTTISGTRTTELTIANLQPSDAGDYTVVVTNPYGSVTSSVAALTVQLPTPIVLTAAGNGGVSSNGFGFNLSGMAGQTVVIEASTNLISWTPLLTNVLVTGSFYFHDPDAANFARRFYRAILASDATNSTAPSLQVTVDPRVELLSLIFRLAGNPEYNMGRVASYNQDAERQFGSFRNHAVVSLAIELRQTRGVSFDAVMSLAVHLTDLEGLNLAGPLDPWPANLDPRWTASGVNDFLTAARQFVRDTGFRTFLEQHQSLYETTVTRLGAMLEESAHLEWYESFFGERPGASFTVVPALFNGGANYGPRFRDLQGREALYSILGVWKTDGAGLPEFTPDMLGTVVHEFSHSFANPVIDRHMAELAAAGEKIFPHVAEQMRAQGYGNAGTMLRESLVRASTVRFVHRYEGAEAARRAAQAEADRGFLWTADLADLLGEYEAQRDTYPTLDSFAPRLVEFFTRYAEDLDDLADKRPKVVSMTPANGAQNVSPDLAEIKVVFDRTMLDRSWAMVGGGPNFPEITGPPHYDAALTTWTVPVKLKSDWSYEFWLNRGQFDTFRSAEGVPLDPVHVTFKTAAQ